jgi:hypothetical protein
MSVSELSVHFNSEGVTWRGWGGMAASCSSHHSRWTMCLARFAFLCVKDAHNLDPVPYACTLTASHVALNEPSCAKEINCVYIYVCLCGCIGSVARRNSAQCDDILHIGSRIHDVVLHLYKCIICSKLDTHLEQWPVSQDVMSRWQVVLTVRALAYTTPATAAASVC